MADDGPQESPGEPAEVVLDAALSELRSAGDLPALQAWRRRHLGPGGTVSALLSRVPRLPADQRAAAGRSANQAKRRLESAGDARAAEVEAEAAAARAAAETRAFDLTEPGRRPPTGRIHPSHRTIRLLLEALGRLGFQCFDSPEIEGDEFNFGLLNMPEGHPAREMWDTIYVDRPGMLLRTHTSPGQIRAMRRFAPHPIRIALPGKCYRHEEVSARSEWMFHQLEGLVVGRGVSLANLVHTLETLIRAAFGAERRTRFRKSYFPFTEPSVEVDMDCGFCGGPGCRLCKHSGWVEILGGGMVHRTVLANGGYDPDEFTGFAFGLGPERVAMLRHDVADIRYFFRNDPRFLELFP